MNTPQHNDAQYLIPTIKEMIAKGYLSYIQDLVKLCFNPAYQPNSLSTASLVGAGLLDGQTWQVKHPDLVKRLLEYKEGKVFLFGSLLGTERDMGILPVPTIASEGLINTFYTFGKVRNPTR